MAGKILKAVMNDRGFKELRWVKPEVKSTEGKIGEIKIETKQIEKKPKKRAKKK